MAQLLAAVGVRVLCRAQAAMQGRVQLACGIGCMLKYKRLLQGVYIVYLLSVRAWGWRFLTLTPVALAADSQFCEGVLCGARTVSANTGGATWSIACQLPSSVIAVERKVMLVQKYCGASLLLLPCCVAAQGVVFVVAAVGSPLQPFVL